MRLEGKKAIITAAASGMGRAGVKLFASEGAQVIAIDINPSVEEVAKEFNAQAIIADLSKVDVVKDSIRNAIELLGGSVDILWSHLGVPGSDQIEDLSEEQFNFAMQMNILSAIASSGVAIPKMQNGGSIIFTASVSGLVGSPLSPLYSAAKSGVVGLAKSLALRYAPQNIRVNAICPGPVDTPMLIQFASRTGNLEEAAANKQKLLLAIPLGRLGQPEDIASAALWLGSDDSGFVTGIALPVDGGYTAR